MFSDYDSNAQDDKKKRKKKAKKGKKNKKQKKETDAQKEKRLAKEAEKKQKDEEKELQKQENKTLAKVKKARSFLVLGMSANVYFPNIPCRRMEIRAPECWPLVFPYTPMSDHPDPER